MGNNFACYKTSKPRNPSKINNLSSVEQSILKCKLCRDNIKDIMKRLEITAKKKLTKVKELIQEKNKERAKVYLKQHKFHQEQIKVVDGQLVMIENQIAEIEKSHQMSEVLKTLDHGNKVLKELQEDLKLEKFEDIKTELKELREQNDEISQFFQKYGIDEAECDKDVAEELEKFEKEMKKDVNKEEDMKLPDAPKNEIKWKEAEMLNAA